MRKRIIGTAILAAGALLVGGAATDRTFFRPAPPKILSPTPQVLPTASVPSNADFVDTTTKSILAQTILTLNETPACMTANPTEEGVVACGNAADEAIDRAAYAIDFQDEACKLLAASAFQSGRDPAAAAQPCRTANQDNRTLLTGAVQTTQDAVDRTLKALDAQQGNPPPQKPRRQLQHGVNAVTPRGATPGRRSASLTIA